MKDIKFEEITIIGPGLIGASLGLILKKKKIAKKIVGIDVSKKNIKDAINNKSIDEGRLKVDEKIRRSNVIFICTMKHILNSFIGNTLPRSNKIIIHWLPWQRMIIALYTSYSTICT